MKNGVRAVAMVAAGVWLSASGPVHAHAGACASGSAHKEAVVATQASGTFDVKLAPQTLEETADGTFGRMSIDKQFHGDLEATSKGEMLSAMGSVQGSAGYVAIELVTGTLQGRTGTFVLQHSGTMAHGALQLLITIVPDSGTGQLAGISGAMAIKIVGKDHFYELVYSLPPE